MLRPILIILAGFITWTVLWLGSNAVLSTLFADSFREDGSTDSTGLLLLLIALSVVFSAVAGYLVARLSANQPMRQALILGGILLVVGIFVQSQFWDLLPIWYHLSFLVLLVPATALGAKLIPRS
ncbi:MAG: hypothetical protein AAF629_04170 [Chloroflexota bacterium]